jgi:hypothetical protein
MMSITHLKGFSPKYQWKVLDVMPKTSGDKKYTTSESLLNLIIATDFYHSCTSWKVKK